MRLLTALFLVIAFSAAGQSMPDSITVTYTTYVNRLQDGDTIYSQKEYHIVADGNEYRLENTSISASLIKDLIMEISRPDHSNLLLSDYGIDTAWIVNNPTALLKLYKNEERFKWNKLQKEYIFPVLTDLALYKNQLNEYLLAGGSYHMHNWYKYEYRLMVYYKGEKPHSIQSRKFASGYMMPWITDRGQKLWNYSLENTLNKVLSTERTLGSPSTGKKLLRYLVNEIVEYRVSTLEQLAAYAYQKEIDELKTDFSIIGSGEVYIRGGYQKKGYKAIKVELKSREMYDNVSLFFFATKQGGTIYTRDSIKKDYKQYIDRVQGIPFISSYLKAHPRARLTIHYFDNRGINGENIDNVNKDSLQWKRFDDYARSLEKDKELGRKYSFDIDEAIRVAKQLDCGCNFRFSSEFIGNAVLFTIKDENGFYSTWYLLPDNKVLLYFQQGEAVLDLYTKASGELSGFGYPCIQHEPSGKPVSKPVVGE